MTRMSIPQAGPKVGPQQKKEAVLQPTLENGDEPKSSLEPSLDCTDGVAQDEPPEGGYGWVCVAVCFMINAHTWGLNSVRP
jgi:hypothetical protein